MRRLARIALLCSLACSAGAHEPARQAAPPADAAPRATTTPTAPVAAEADASDATGTEVTLRVLGMT